MMDYSRGVINTGNLNRMKRVMAKADTGAMIRIAFIGGSITAGAAATNSENCYVYLVYDWWKNKFPQSEVIYLNAGVGATTSQYGAARVSEDVLDHDPDVVFAEFSVNDEDNEFYAETFEGLIRKILSAESEPALFLFNNVFYDDGHNAQRVHNAVGKYYDLPIVSMKESIYYLIEQGIYSNKDISADNLHPNDLGHQLVSEVIINHLEYIYHTVNGAEDDGRYRIPEVPFTKNRYFHAIRWNNQNAAPVLKGFHKDEVTMQGIWDVFRYGWFSDKENSSIRFELEGSIISVLYRKYAIHPAPKAKLIIDGRVDEAIILDADFDETWGDKLFLQDIAADLPYQKHSIEIIITKAVKEREFYLASVITA